MDTQAPDLHTELTRLYSVKKRIESDISRLEAALTRQQSERSEARMEARREARKAEAAARARRLVEIRFNDEEQIRMLVAEQMGVDESFLTDKSRTAHLVEARAVAYFVARGLGWSLPRIGEWAGRDHTTVMHGINRARERADLIDKAAQVRSQIRSDAA